MMSNSKKLVFTVTTDLNYDQRMLRICKSLTYAGFHVLLIGREMKSSAPLVQQSFNQKRIKCFFLRGKLFYLEYWIRLFLYLLFRKMDILCSIDLDTIIPVYLVSVLRRKKRVFDAHELFCEMKEVVSRKIVRHIWKFIERSFMPRFPHGYTVSQPICEIFKKEYGLNYQLIMNLPYYKEMGQTKPSERFILYQGSVNEGRSFETIIPAFKMIDCPLWILGDGNFFEKCKSIIVENQLEGKVLLKGKVLPEVLKSITQQALIGINLLENNGLNNYYSLSNRFFDYIQAQLPQICIDFPAYRSVNDQWHIANMINDLAPTAIASQINSMIADAALLERLRTNCRIASKALNWQKQEMHLVSFYENLFSS